MKYPWVLRYDFLHPFLSLHEMQLSEIFCEKWNHWRMDTMKIGIRSIQLNSEEFSRRTLDTMKNVCLCSCSPDILACEMRFKSRWNVRSFKSENNPEDTIQIDAGHESLNQYTEMSYHVLNFLNMPTTFPNPSSSFIRVIPILFFFSWEKN